MNNAIFITEDYLKQNTIINGNVDNKYIVMQMRAIEDMYIQTILGTALYKELSDQVTSGMSFVSAKNKTLIEDYIQPCMIFYFMSEAAYDMVYKWENKGIVKKFSDNSQTIELSEIEKIAANKRKYADFYAQRLIDFLQENDTVYPLYFTGNTRTDQMKPTDTMYRFGGIHFPRGYKRNYNDSVGSSEDNP